MDVGLPLRITRGEDGSSPLRSRTELGVRQVLFSVYCYLLTRRVSKPLNAAPADLEVLQNAYKRMLQSGLTPRRGNAEGGEDLLYERPASPAETIEHLEFDDLRAIDFRNRMRTW